MRYVYILSDYEEDGAEHVVATLDRSRLYEMLDANWGDHDCDWVAEARISLNTLLAMPDEDLARKERGWDFHHTWAGIQLHVVELVE